MESTEDDTISHGIAANKVASSQKAALHAAPTQSSKPPPPDLQENSQHKALGPSASLVSEIRALQERLAQLQWQATAEAGWSAKEGLAPCDELVDDDALAELNYMAWENFKGVRHTPARLSFVIDVLVGEPDISNIAFWRYFGVTKNSGPTTTAKSKPPVAQLVHYDGAGILPERIRIHSKQLIKALSIVHGSELGLGVDYRDKNSMVMLRPYRTLTYYDKELRNWYEKLAKDIRKPKSATGSAAGAVKPLQEVTLKETTGTHLIRNSVSCALKYANNVTSRRCSNGKQDRQTR